MTFFGLVKFMSSCIRANQGPVGGNVFVLRLDNTRVRTGFYFEKLIVNDISVSVTIRPEIVTVYRTVSKPQRFMVRMVFTRL